ncbi:hypothetical protein N9K06_01755, partial [Omnitrophica bacterium]|nr:hypothetical protein [Candidatus Omnitrophota bacterium]
MSHSKSTADKSEFGYIWWPLTLLALGAILIYGNVLRTGFILDDNNTIIHNVDIRSLGLLLQKWSRLSSRFMSRLTFQVNYSMGGFDPFIYHVTNLLIHYLTAVVVFFLTRFILRYSDSSLFAERSVFRANGRVQNGFAFFVAALFLVHPIQTQAVAYITQRDASLASLFYLLSLWFYAMDGHRLFSLKIVLSWVFFAFAIYSKLIALTLPAALILYEVCFKRLNAENIKRMFLRILPYMFLASLIFIANGFYVSKTKENFLPVAPREFSNLEYLFTQFNVLCTYIRLLFLPYNQNLDYDYPISRSLTEPNTIFAIVFLVIVFALGVWAYWKKRRLVAFGIFWFFITLSIESSFIPLEDVIFEHRLYLPMFGFS